MPSRYFQRPGARWSVLFTCLLVGLCAEPGCTFPEYDAATGLNVGATGLSGSTSDGGGSDDGSTSGGSVAGDAAGGLGQCGAEPCSTCAAGRADCNQLSDDGCEISLTSDADCGACGVACTNEHGTNVCVADDSAPGAHCEPSCAPGYQDCDLHASNGCETNLNNDVLNCGACGRGCPASGGQPLCAGGKCGVSSCNIGFGDCSNQGACTDNLATDPLNCGQCGFVCSSAHGEARCSAGSCVTDCEAGYGDCNGDSVNDGCETKLNQPDGGGSVPNCGACGALCQRRSFTTVNLEQCAQGVCYRDCMDGARDCSNNRNEPGCSGKTCGCEFEPCP